MSRYRKLPVVVHAVELRRDNWPEMAEFLGNEFFSRIGGKAILTDTTISVEIPTMSGGTVMAEEGDFIIRGVDCRYYPLRPAVFHETYEAAEE